MTTNTTPTAAEMNAEAAEMGFALRFEYETTTFEDVWVPDADQMSDHKEHVEIHEYQAYNEGLPYGIWAKVSTEPEKLHHGFYVVFAEDATETNGTAYEDLCDALRYMRRLMEAGV